MKKPLDDKIMRFFLFYVDNIKLAYAKGYITRDQLKNNLEEWEKYGIDKELIEEILRGIDLYVMLTKSKYPN